MLDRTLTTPATDTAPGAQSDLTTTYGANGMIASVGQTIFNTSGENDAIKMAYGLDPAGVINSVTTTMNGAETRRLRYRFSGPGDAPAVVETSVDQGANWTAMRYVSVPEAGMVASKSSDVELQIINLHGDISATAAPSGAAIDSYAESDEYGNAIDSAQSARYGWLGGYQRSGDALGGAILMGARQYNPKTGSFGSVDPVYGGNATAYSYPLDPVNTFDLDGRFLIDPGQGRGGPVKIPRTVSHGWFHRHWRTIANIGVTIVGVGAALACGASVVCGVAVGVVSG